MTDGEKMDGVFIIRESKIKLPHNSPRELSFPSQIEIRLALFSLVASPSTNFIPHVLIAKRMDGCKYMT
jgi:hypothetical protein